MRQASLEVRNRTGVTQLYAAEGVELEPGRWTPVPRLLAYRLLRDRIVDVRLPRDQGSYVGMPRFMWMSPFSMGDGYATGAEHLLHAVIRAGAKPFVRSCWFCVKDGLLSETVELLEAPPDVDALHMIGLCMATPGEFSKLPTPYRIGLTMYESTNPLEYHPEWRHECNAVDRLFVPSEWCKQLFGGFVDRPIDVVPLAVNPMYCVGEQLERAPKDTFTFFQYATLTGRKAPLETLEAFQKAFPRASYPNVRMVFKTRLGIFGWDENMLPEVNDERVRVVDDNWYPGQLFEYLRDHVDCMVYPSRGEGFGLPPREAMAMGVPTILTQSSGMIDVCDARYNWPVEVKETRESILGGHWDEPAWDQVISHMRAVQRSPEAAFAKARRGAEWFKREHGPDAAGRYLYRTLAALDPGFPEVEYAALPTPVTEHGLRQLAEVHAPYYDFARRHIPPGAVVLVFGVEAGAELARLLREGYNAWGITDDPERAAIVRETLLGLRINPGRLGLVPSLVAYQVAPRGFPRSADAAVSFSVLEHYGDREIARMLIHQLKIAPTVLLSVPSVHSARPELGDERLMRLGQWRDILKDFAAETYYYSGKTHIAGAVTGYDQGRGGLQRRWGYMRQGTWRPLHAPGKGITLHDRQE